MPAGRMKYNPQFLKDKKTNRKRFPRRKKSNYNRKNVSNKVSARAPIVECKKRTLGVRSGVSGGNHLVPTAYFHSFPCTSFLNQEQGIGDDQMIGNTIFSKYYSMKIKLVFPEEFPINDNFRAQLVWGWVTQPLGYTNTAFTSTGATTRDKISATEIHNRITNVVMDGFNQNVDQMNFRDKEKSLYKVVGKKWIRLDRRNQIGMKQGSTAYIDPDDDTVKIASSGSLPAWTEQVTFKPMRKVRYTFSTGEDNGSPGTGVPHWYPNENWIPWVGIYTPNIASYYKDSETGVTPDGGKITVQINDCHWYTDS